MDREPPKTGSFPRTRWSLVVRAQAGDETAISPGMESGKALESLCATYWKPIYAFVRRSGFDVQDAEDITQDFIAWFVSKDHLAEVDQSKGRLRSYFLALLRRFMADHRRRVNAVKRGGRHHIVSIDQDDAENWYETLPSSAVSPDEIFEKRWAVSLMESAISKLRTEYTARDQAKLFETISRYLQHRPGADGYRQTAEAMGTSVAAVKMHVHRLRKRFGDLYREEVMQTLDGTSDLDEELAHVRALFDR